MYLGGLLTILTFPLWVGIASPIYSVIFGVIFLAPGGIDGTTQMFGNRESTNGLRAITGLFLGIGVVQITYGSVFFLLPRLA